jgi:hypothetical protein
MSTQAAYRAAAVSLLEGYAADAAVKLQVYPGRPRSIFPPTAFVDSISESFVYTGPTLRQRTPRVEVIVLHGLFDTKDTVDQKDAFVDGFLDWVNTRYHAAGAATLIAVVATQDIPNYVPDWLPPEQQRVYFATSLTLEGFATN